MFYIYQISLYFLSIILIIINYKKLINNVYLEIFYIIIYFIFNIIDLYKIFSFENKKFNIFKKSLFKIFILIVNQVYFYFILILAQYLIK